MKNFRKIVFAVLAAIVLVSTVAVLTPRAVHALAAQLVQDVDSPPRNPWTASCATANTTTNVAYCIISAVPGYEITVQTVTVQGYTSELHEHVILQLVTTTGGNYEFWNNQLGYVITQPEQLPLELPGYTGTNQHNYVSTQPVTLYVDPTNPSTVPPTTNTIAVYFQTDSGNPHGMAAVVTLTGYVVNLGTPAN
jgi:hypothetical protein